MSSDTTPHVLYISEEFETDIQRLSDFFGSSLWREHFGSDSIDSLNWENHFFNEAERDTFIANMATLCSAMRIISPQWTSAVANPSHLRTLVDACSPSGWLTKKLSHESEYMKQHPGSWVWFQRRPLHTPALPPWVKVDNQRAHAALTLAVLNLMQTVMQQLDKMYQIFNEGRESGYYKWAIVRQAHTQRPIRAAVAKHHRSATGDPRPQNAGLQVCLDALKELYLLQ